MPNGGVPLHMILFPSNNSNYVILCHGGTLSVFTRQEWDLNKAQGKSLITLTEAEGSAIAGFLKYWLGDHRLSPCHPEKGVTALYDW